MQNSEKKIDGLFRDKLGSHEVAPPPAVWNNIVGSLDGRNRKRRMIWVLGLSSAASLLFAFLAGWYLSGQVTPNGELQAENNKRVSTTTAPANNENEIQNSTITKDNERSTPMGEVESASSEIKHAANTFVTPSKTAAQKQMGTDVTATNESTENFILRLLSPQKTHAQSGQQNNYELIAMNTDGLTDADRAIIAGNLEMKNQSGKNDQNSTSGFGVGLQASPVYRFDGSPSVHADYLNGSGVSGGGSQQYMTGITGGIVVSYRPGSRVSIQSGVNYGEISQRGGDVAITFAGHNQVFDRGLFGESYFGEPLISEASNSVVLNTNMGLATIDVPAGVELATANTSNKFTNEATRNYSLKQQAGYLEIPLIVRYRIVDQRLGFHLLGGVNTNVLMSNNASLVDNNNVVANGKTEGLNPLTFSSSIGMGMNYAISERFNLSLEPTMKIQLSSLNSQGYYNARPYTVGVFTGVTYNF
jgi:hypothetical protein